MLTLTSFTSPAFRAKVHAAIRQVVTESHKIQRAAVRPASLHFADAQVWTRKDDLALSVYHVRHDNGLTQLAFIDPAGNDITATVRRALRHWS